MILEFSVENFKSFKELQTLSLTAQPLRHKYQHLKENTFVLQEEVELLKTKVVFGANASGKSNLIKALAAFVQIVINSVKDNGILQTLVEPFMLSKDSLNKPSFFQLTFIVDGIRYRYGFEASNTKIEHEWLFGKPGKKEVPYFTRSGNEITPNDKQFPEGKKFKSLLQEGNEIVRPNALFLTAAALLNAKISKSIVSAISSILIISGIDDHLMKGIAYKALEDDHNKQKVISFLKESGIDIEDINMERVVEVNIEGELPEELKAFFKVENNLKILTSTRTQYDDDQKAVGKIGWSFERHESDGTQKMVQLSPFILASLEQGRVLILDEFEARLHTSLSKRIVQLYNSNKSNTKNAQFIFSTHDTNLLSAKMMRRDQISFTQKDQYGASKLFSLAEIKGVRNDENYEKNYLLGKYRATPNIGDLTAVLDPNS
ncbi:MAG: ATP-binding protein [Bacteroidota bacterium]